MAVDSNREKESIHIVCEHLCCLTSKTMQIISLFSFSKILVSPPPFPLCVCVCVWERVCPGLIGMVVYSNKAGSNEQ